MELKKISKAVVTGAMLSLLVVTSSVTAFAASEVLNGGGAKWSGGENADGILYSQVEDMKDDGVAYEATVWCQSDDGQRSEKFGTTNAVGKKGRVRTTRAATHDDFFEPERCGYKNYKAVAAK